MSRKMFGMADLMAQEVNNIRPVQKCGSTGLKVHQEDPPLGCSPLDSPLLLVQLLPGGFLGLPQDCYPALTDARRISIPPVC